MAEAQPSLLAGMERIHAAAAAGDDGERCMVAAAPELHERIVAEDVPVATAETGRAVLSVAILLEGPGGGVTGACPWAPPELADRCGPLPQDAVWTALRSERGEA